MKIMQLKTEELTGEFLFEAVRRALRKSYADWCLRVNAMTLADMLDYFKKEYLVLPPALLDDGEPDTRPEQERLHDYLIGSHEPRLSDEDDLVESTEEELWPLCEHLLERYGIEMSMRVAAPSKDNPTKPLRIWWAEPEGRRMVGATAREAILRYYVAIKLGEEVEFTR